WAPDALARGAARVSAAGGTVPFHVGGEELARSHVRQVLVGEHADPVLDHRGVVRGAVSKGDEGGGVMTGAERVVDHEPLDLPALAPLCRELTVAEGVAPGDAPAFGGVEAFPVELSCQLGLGDRPPGPRVAG